MSGNPRSGNIFCVFVCCLSRIMKQCSRMPAVGETLVRVVSVTLVVLSHPRTLHEGQLLRQMPTQHCPEP